MLSGMGTVAHVEENVAAVDAASAEAAGSDERLQELLDGYAAAETDDCTLCQKCLPCPEGLPIPAYMHVIDVQNQKGPEAGYGTWEWHKARGNFARTKAGTCTDCGDCEPRCPKKISIVRSLKQVHDLWESDEARARQKAVAS